MSYFKIKKLQKEHISPYNVKKFLFKMIQDEFGFGFIPEYHQDIKNMEDYYLDLKETTSSWQLTMILKKSLAPLE